MKIISLGAGVQSTTLYLMSSLGEIDRADHAIFADPGKEKPETYDHVNFLINWGKGNGAIPLHWQKNKNLYQDLLNHNNYTGQRFASIPAYTNQGQGQLRRQCTKEYKIDVVISKIRELYGLKKHQWLPQTEIWIGFSADEILRVKDSKNSRIIYRHPLLELIFRRSDCIKWLKDHNFPVPVKSSCEFCPFQSDASWRTTKIQHPEEWADILAVDESIENSTKKGIKEKARLHRSGIPLKDVRFGDQGSLFDENCVEGFCAL